MEADFSMSAIECARCVRDVEKKNARTSPGVLRSTTNVDFSHVFVVLDTRAEISANARERISR